MEKSVGCSLIAIRFHSLVALQFSPAGRRLNRATGKFQQNPGIGLKVVNKMNWSCK